MAELKPSEAHQVARRLHLVQSLLNYRLLQGGGYLFALWPWLRRNPNCAEHVRAASGYANAHPVLASLAVGAMRRRLADGDMDDIEAWRRSLSGPLGIVGDSLIWDRWKPLVFATGALFMLWIPGIASWVAVAAACLILYNVPLYQLRVWGVKTGYRLGRQVLDALRDERFSRWRLRLGASGIILAGALFGTALFIGAQGALPRGLQFLVAFAMMLVCLHVRLSAGTAAMIAIVAALAFPLLS